MPQLDNYLVSLGLKGQKVVLSVMDKIQKKGKDLTKKKTTVPLAVKTVPDKDKKTAPEEKPEPGKRSPGKPSEKPAFVPGKRSPGKPSEKPAFVPGPSFSDQEKTNKRFSAAVDKFHGGAKDIASAASSLDPAATISSVTSAVGTSLSGLSFATISLGRLPEGIAHMANAALSMAKNSVDMAKQATAAYHALASRNAAAEHYGGMVGAGPMSRNERAMFIDVVSNSMGRIQKPLADEINKLVGTKDTRALARASAGDWESTGTDKGWMLGQLSSSFGGLPPSIRQKLQAELLKNYSGEIQEMKPGSEQDIAQRKARSFTDLEEDQTAALASRNTEGALEMTKTFNKLQLNMFDGGLKLVKTVNAIGDTFNDLISVTPKVVAGLNNLVNLLKDPSFANAFKVLKTFSGGTPRAGK